MVDEANIHAEAMAELINNADNLSVADSNESRNETLPLAVLFKFVRPFSGDRRELSSFLQNGNSAFSLASATQQNALLLYVVSQLSTSVVNEVALSEVHTWDELKSRLRLYYSHTKHLAQAHEELEIIKQHSNETITDFFKRVERAKNDCLQAEILNNQDYSKDCLPGLKRSIQQTALRRFIIHCHPAISVMLRAREIATLNEAFSLALQEEKILNYTKPRSQKGLYCSFCDQTNHSLENCNKRKQRSHNIQPRRAFNQNDHPRVFPNRYPSDGQPRYNHPPRNNFPPRSQSSPFFHGNTDRPQYNRPNGDRPPFRPSNDQPRRFYNNDATGTNARFENPRVNNVQSEDLNCHTPLSNAPMVDQDIQEAFRAMSLI